MKLHSKQLVKGAEPAMWKDMETLAKQIERQMHGVWKHCMIRDVCLESIFPTHEPDREEKIAQFATKHGFRLRFFRQGMCAIFDKWPPQET